jgi:trans-aconitate methyltransferase
VGDVGEWALQPLKPGELRAARNGLSLGDHYLQILSDLYGIVELCKSTGLRPYLDRIEDDEQRQEFLAEYRSRLHRFHPKSVADGVPFLFRRISLLLACEARSQKPRG